MSEPAYTDYHQIRGTSLVIYKRKNSGAFQVRMNIEGVKGYIVKSSKKKSLDEAIETAEVMYEDYRYSHGDACPEYGYIAKNDIRPLFAYYGSSAGACAG